MGDRDYKIHDDHYPYFITSSLRFGLPLFNNPKAAEIILENLNFLQNERDVRLTAYIIMENHLHIILQGDDLAQKFGQFKSYSARKIIDLLKAHQRSRWLKRLKMVKQEFKTDQDFQLWEERFQPKRIIGDKMMLQKIYYIHQNPVKRGYVGKAEHWRYSSARNYAGDKGLIPVELFRGCS